MLTTVSVASLSLVLRLQLTRMFLKGTEHSCSLKRTLFEAINLALHPLSRVPLQYSHGVGMPQQRQQQDRSAQTHTSVLVLGRYSLLHPRAWPSATFFIPENHNLVLQWGLDLSQHYKWQHPPQLDRTTQWYQLHHQSGGSKLSWEGDYETHKQQRWHIYLLTTTTVQVIAPITTWRDYTVVPTTPSQWL